jgi:hypothetical protein
MCRHITGTTCAARKAYNQKLIDKDPEAFHAKAAEYARQYRMLQVELALQAMCGPISPDPSAYLSGLVGLLASHSPGYATAVLFSASLPGPNDC